MTMRHWTLDGHTAVRGATLQDWGRMFDNAEARTVGKTEVNGWFVSTVFLGIDHNFGGGPPLLFETMIFSHHEPRNDHDEGCWRYTTWEEAEQGHAAVVAWLTADPTANTDGPDVGC